MSNLLVSRAMHGFHKQCQVHRWYVASCTRNENMSRRLSSSTIQLDSGFFCDIRNNQVLGKGCQPQPLASADSIYLDLDYSGYQKNFIQ